MDLNNKILKELGSGKTPDDLAKELDMRRETIEAILELMVHRGVIKEIDCDSACSNCFMGKSCPGAAAGREKLYVVSEDIEESLNPP